MFWLGSLNGVLFVVWPQRHKYIYIYIERTFECEHVFEYTNLVNSI